MAQFVLMLRDNGNWTEGVSPEGMQQMIQKYREWREGVGGTGKKLCDGEGRVLVRKNGAASVTDGPYAESAEVIGGFFLIDANDYDDAVRIASDCPHMEFGSIEIRQVDKV